MKFIVLCAKCAGGDKKKPYAGFKRDQWTGQGRITIAGVQYVSAGAPKYAGNCHKCGAQVRHWEGGLYRAK